MGEGEKTEVGLSSVDVVFSEFRKDFPVRGCCCSEKNT